MTKLLENDRGRVGRFVAEANLSYASSHLRFRGCLLHQRRSHHCVAGGRPIAEQLRAWDTFFLRRGLTHSEEGASEQPLRGVFVEFKMPQLHARDAVIVAFTKLKPRVTFVERGTVHNDEQASGADRVFAFEVK